MIIACATDRRYVQLTGVMLASLIAKGDVPEAKLVVFGWQLTPRDKRLLRYCCGEQASRLTFIDLDATIIARLRGLRLKRPTITHTAYLRLLMPALLDAGERRLLYLDSDVVVNGSLRPLLEMPLNGHALAAVAECEASRIRCNKALGVPPAQPYMNSGVLLIDLEAWRARRLTDRTIAFARDNPLRGNYHDQDALNAVLAGDWLQLDRRWNFFEPASEPPREAREVYLASSVIHFIGVHKPTSAECTNPAQALFLQYRRLTPWRHRRLITRFERRMRKLLAKRFKRLRQGFALAPAPGLPRLPEAQDSGPETLRDA